MDLLLWRHAEAGNGSPDSARTLTPRGEKQSQRIAHWLDEHAPDKLRILVSPTTRTRQTIEAWRSDYEVSAEVGLDATAHGILAAAGWPKAGGAVLVVGHQPTLGRAASLLLHGDEADLAFKKGALWWFQWREHGAEPQTTLKAVICAEML